MCQHSHAAAAAANSRRTFLSTLLASLPTVRLFAQSAESNAAGVTASTAERFRKMSEEFERKGLAEPFKGITDDGNIVPGLFPIQPTGVSTAGVRSAAEKFLTSLTADQRAKTMFPIDDPECRKWMNQHFYVARE